MKRSSGHRTRAKRSVFGALVFFWSSLCDMRKRRNTPLNNSTILKRRLGLGRLENRRFDMRQTDHIICFCKEMSVTWDCVVLRYVSWDGLVSCTRQVVPTVTVGARVVQKSEDAPCMAVGL